MSLHFSCPATWHPSSYMKFLFNCPVHFVLPTQPTTVSWADVCLLIYYQSLVFSPKDDPQSNEIKCGVLRELAWALGWSQTKQMVQILLLPATRNIIMYKISKYSVL